MPQESSGSPPPHREEAQMAEGGPGGWGVGGNWGRQDGGVGGMGGAGDGSGGETTRSGRGPAGEQSQAHF